MKVFIRKINNKFRKKAKVIDFREFEQVSVGSSTIMLNSTIRHDVSRENRKYVYVGNDCLIRAQFIFESEKGQITIGNNVHIGGATLISRESIVIGDDVTLAWDVTIYDHNSHSIYWEDRKNDNFQCMEDYIKFNGNNVVNKDWSCVKSAPIIIQNKVWIGFGVTILKGVTIGEGAVVGAKSVVTKSVPAWSVVAGNPAKVVKSIKK